MTANHQIQMRDAFISRLHEKVRTNPNIVFVSNEYGAPSLDRFRSEFPTRFINAGISEQNIISVAAGLALGGKKVIVYSIASFITLRCLEQLKLDICVHKLPVVIMGVGTCYSYSEDGPTHHASEDIAVMRPLAGLEIYSPSDAELAAELVDVTLTSAAPSYVRLDRTVSAPLSRVPTDWESGFRQLRTGSDLCICSTGGMIHTALAASEQLAARGVKASVIDLFKLKPINESRLIDLLRSFRHVVSVEEHALFGGLGSILAELIVDSELPLRLKRFAVKDSDLYAYGVRTTLHKKSGLTAESIASSVVHWMDGKNHALRTGSPAVAASVER